MEQYIKKIDLIFQLDVIRIEKNIKLLQTY